MNKLINKYNIPIITFLLLLFGLPFVTYYTFHELQVQSTLNNSKSYSNTIAAMREYYSDTVIKRVLENPHDVKVLAEYKNVPGAIPIPAKLSIELSEKLKSKQTHGFDWNFASDQPFRNRPPLDEFQKESLKLFRENNQKEHWKVVSNEAGMEVLRYSVPIVMKQNCLNCHNSHAKQIGATYNWKVGDIRGLQDVKFPIYSNNSYEHIYAFSAYLILFSLSVIWLVLHTQRTNKELITTNLQLHESQAIEKEQKIKIQESFEQLKKLNIVLEKAPFGLLFIDVQKDNFPIIYKNSLFSQMQAFSHFQHENDFLSLFKNEQNLLLEKIKKAHTYEFESEIQNENSSYWIQVLIFPIHNSENELIAYAVTLNDITEIKTIKEQQSKLFSELIETQKSESLSLTIAGIAHDLNTPIGVALTSTSHLENTVKKLINKIPEEQQQEYQKQIDSLNKTCSLISNNLLKAGNLVKSFKETTANSSKTDWQIINIKTFFDTLIMSVSPILKKHNCLIELNCPEKLFIYSEPGSLGQIFTNLIVNSTIHAFKPNMTSVRTPLISISIEKLDKALNIYYKDNGVGMSQETLNQVFTPFFTTNKTNGGSGLGLFTSRRIAQEILKGNLTLESSENEGCKFTLFIPLENEKKV